MAEQDTHQLPADVKEGQTLSTNMDDASASEGAQQEKRLEGLSSAPTNEETENDNGEDTKADVKNDVPAEEEAVLPTSMLTGADNRTQSQAEESCVDHNKERQSNQELTKTSEEISGDGRDPDRQNSSTSSPQTDNIESPPPTSEEPTELTAPTVTQIPGGESHIVEKKMPEMTALPTPNDRKDNQVDAPSTTLDEQTTDTEIREGESHIVPKKLPETTALPTPDDQKDNQVDGPSKRLDKKATDSKIREGSGSGSDRQKSTTSTRTAQQQRIPDKEDIAEQQKDFESTPPTSEEPAELTAPTVTQIPGESRRNLILLGTMVVVLAILMPYLLQPETPPQKQDVRQIDIFLRQMDKLKTQFPNQRAEVWSRSRIHMLRHLQTAQPTEPVSLILTAGARAEMTLRCLAQGLASAFSSALNASVLHIDGTGKASQDSDEVKLDIDSKLQGAFEGDKPVAVIHRFEELPPGSTLIFYRYCDHENAAYKKTCLIFTVLLEEEEEISAKSRLSTVEEMVDDHLQKKFLSGDQPVSFDRMDLDKYGGLWSRISHLILPVTAEEKMEREGCLETSL